MKLRPTLAAAAAAVAALGLGLVLVGCGAIGSLVSTQDGLRGAGYGSVSVGISGDNLKASVSVPGAPGASDAKGVARVVWRDFHDRFDTLDVTVHGRGPTLQQRYSFGEVEQMFGPRNPSWNRTTLLADTTRVGEEVVGVLVAAAVVVAVVVTVVVRRRRRRRRGRPAVYQHTYPPPGYGQPGYGQAPFYPPPADPPRPGEQPG